MVLRQAHMPCHRIRPRAGLFMIWPAAMWLGLLAMLWNSLRAGLLAAVFFAAGLCAGLQGCASQDGWPIISKVVEPDKVLSPAEVRKAVQDLQMEKAAKSDSKSGQ